jgi:hypothetical protein
MVYPPVPSLFIFLVPPLIESYQPLNVYPTAFGIGIVGVDSNITVLYVLPVPPM